jgi:hypothetical protein
VFNADTARIDFDSSVQSVDLNLKTSLGKFFISDSAFQLIDIISDGQNTRAEKNMSISGNTADLSLYIDNKSYVFKDDDQSGRATKVKLNNRPVWNITAKTGAADFEADLSRLKLQSLTLKGGAASITLKLGEMLDHSQISIKTGASSVKVYVPKGVGCTLKAKTGLSDLNASGFENVGHNFFRSNNYDSTAKKIDIEVKGGMSSFVIDKY